MVKLIGFVRRKPGMSVADFRHYWKDVHYPLVRDLPEIKRYVLRYVQSHALDWQPTAPGAPTPQPYDGVAELWFDNAEDLAAAFSSPVYAQVVNPDELKFLDLPNCVSLIIEEDIKDDIR